MLRATLSGNVGNDAELKFTADGKPILRVNVASNYRERDQSGEWQDRVEWVRVTVLGPRAESLAPYVVKGTKVAVVGRLTARPWTSQQDQSLRAGLEILVDDIDIMTPREGNGNGQERPSGQASRPRQTAALDTSGLPF